MLSVRDSIAGFTASRTSAVFWAGPPDVACCSIRAHTRSTFLMWTCPRHQTLRTREAARATVGQSHHWMIRWIIGIAFSRGRQRRPIANGDSRPFVERPD